MPSSAPPRLRSVLPLTRLSGCARPRGRARPKPPSSLTRQTGSGTSGRLKDQPAGERPRERLVEHGATIFKSLCKRMAVSKCFYRVEALPLVWTRILRLAQISPLDARSPARRPRDDREISGKTSGEISRRKTALCADNGRAVTTATPSNVRQVGSQDNSRCAAVIQAVVAPGTCGTTSKRQQRNSRATVRVTVRATSRKTTCSNLNHDIQKL